ncbi:MAG: bifunctional proline dehydrogenase/L-glutamate gamma-semialdehyde dehydrogenase PutA [Comamonas sp.]
MLPELDVGNGVAELARLRRAIDEASDWPEGEVVARLIQEAAMDGPAVARAQALAARLAQGVRDARIHAGGVDLLTQEFSLDSREGIALMCLAEAMLRIPDVDTRNQLIRDKIVGGDWKAHLGKSPSLFVNATAWGLLFTGGLLRQPDSVLAQALSSALRKGGEAAVRAGVAYAMSLLGRQFVTGQTIGEAIVQARGRERRGYRYSYDMLGEAALTQEDAQAYDQSYLTAIEAIGQAAGGAGPVDGPGVSVKLSGLHPRYERAQRERVLREMYPRLLQLARRARHHQIGFHLDQEESARFDLSLEMLERLAAEPELAGWDGLGISLQAYQKRGRVVADWLIALARATRRRICVRLVKGAYWDTEIKLAQEAGAAGYPVFTRKVHSDVSYLACAKALLAAQDAIFPQFASHNAYTIAAVHTLGEGLDYEFQCLHGMGESVYDQVVGADRLGRNCRIYAPVGPHATLLAYLVRRLLENGANSSFVNQVVDPAVPIADLVEDPVARAVRTGGRPHDQIPLPTRLAPGRQGAGLVAVDGPRGIRPQAAWLKSLGVTAHSLTAAGPGADSLPVQIVRNPADASEVIGRCVPCDGALAVAAASQARQALVAWSGTPASQRATLLESMADRLEGEAARLAAWRVLEGGATLTEASAEVRASVDVCRLYAGQLRQEPAFVQAEPLGVVACLTPAASPLLSMVEAAAAGLAAGNTVIAKPSLAAALVAHEAGRLLLGAGLPAGVLQILIGAGDPVGQALAACGEVDAVVFTGGAAAARAVRQGLADAASPARLISRIHGVAGMLADSSALPEQVVSDAIAALGHAAGQEAASLKILCLQDSTADKVLGMLKGMLGERIVGDPLDPASDVGPVIGPQLAERVEEYLERLQQWDVAVTRAPAAQGSRRGSFVRPALVELGDIGRLRVVPIQTLGPVLHVVRWKTGYFEDAVRQLNRLGVDAVALHTRINEAVGVLLSVTRATAVCVNRAPHQRTIGMQPLAGLAAASAGPAAAGPLAIAALTRGAVPGVPAAHGPFSPAPHGANEKFNEIPVPVRNAARRFEPPAASRQRQHARRTAQVQALLDLAERLVEPAAQRDRLARDGREALRLAGQLQPLALPALAGEENTVEWLPAGTVWCAGRSAASVLRQAVLATAFGNRVALPDGTLGQAIQAVLGESCWLGADPLEAVPSPDEAPDVVLFDRESGAWTPAAAAAGRPARRVAADVEGHYAWSSLVRERVVTINASAAGGNTQLMLLNESGAVEA